MAVAMNVIKVEGLSRFSRDLRKLDNDAPKQLRLIGNKAAEVVAAEARRRAPMRTGRARKSIKASSTRTLSRVRGGGPRVPYYPWLDFGGRVGRRRSVRRQFITSGRYLYPAYSRRRAYVQAQITIAMVNLAEQQGWTVARG